MKVIYKNIRILCFILAYLISHNIHSNAQVKFSIVPLTSTVINVPSNTTATVQYVVTNNTPVTRTLTMQTIQGISQQTAAPGTCQLPFTLSQGQSCTLSLLLDGSALPARVTGGPVVCKTQGPNNPNPDPFLCSQPQLPHILQITTTAPKPTLAISGSNNISMFANGPFTPYFTGQVTITNTSTVSTAYDIAAEIPPGLGGLRQDANNCKTLPPGASCQLIFDSGYAAFSSTAVQVSGSNTLAPVTIYLTVNAPWVTNGDVNAIAYNPATNLVYLGGQFTQVGPRTGTGAPVDETNGLLVTPYGLLNNYIETAISDGSGGWYVGGNLFYVNDASSPYIAHILENGNIDNNFQAKANNRVKTMLLDGSTLYVGGLFTSIGGQTRNRLAALDASTGQATSWNPNVTGSEVTTMTKLGGTVYIGGLFTQVGSDSRTNIAAIDAVSGAVTASWLNNPANGQVVTLINDGALIYAGGAYSTIGGAARTRVAALDPVTGVATAWAPTVNNAVLALAIGGGKVYLGGWFNAVGGQTRNRIAAVDQITGAVDMAWNPDVTGPSSTVYAMHLHNSKLYFGGVFTAVTGQPRNYFAAVDASTGNLLPWNPNANSEGTTLASYNSIVYIGGRFTSLGGQSRSNLAAINANDGTLNTAWNPGANNIVYALLANGSQVYVGGDFTTISGQLRNRIAVLDAASGTAGSWNPYADNSIRAFAANGAIIYAGGLFGTIGGQIRNRIAALDATTGLALPGWDANANNPVYSLLTDGAKLYAGGAFTTIGGTGRNRIAALDLTNGSALPSWDANVGNNNVFTLASSGTTLYLGGDFTSVGGIARNRIAAVSLADGSLVSAWDASANAAVNALAANTLSLYAGGAFATIGGNSSRRFATLNLLTAALIPPSYFPNNTVKALALNGNYFYAGGSFTVFGDLPNSYFAIGYAQPD
ncbi:hypothetical protein ACFORL_04120 [Legionella dresdenensis]|uniref:Transmembrane protein (Fibronectin III domain and Gp5 C-terminal repeat) n=1 Tax=Legionella dresdenensis TaxID=450200 RepID=A0ABV8CDI4_9GAMM